MRLVGLGPPTRLTWESYESERIENLHSDTLYICSVIVIKSETVIPVDILHKCVIVGKWQTFKMVNRCKSVSH